MKMIPYLYLPKLAFMLLAAVVLGLLLKSWWLFLGVAVIGFAVNRRRLDAIIGLRRWR
jgi:hypothetical protein